jgi:hypothetical protein
MYMLWLLVLGGCIFIPPNIKYFQSKLAEINVNKVLGHMVSEEVISNLYHYRVSVFIGVVNLLRAAIGMIAVLGFVIHSSALQIIGVLGLLVHMLVYRWYINEYIASGAHFQRTPKKSLWAADMEDTGEGGQ